jgi:hypothetical protein
MSSLTWDSARSLAEMASRDFDAALQLLAEGAQYITNASGAAIALCRAEYHDMLCRASAGSNAPELGSLLSMEHGLSGESLRSRRIQRCDDAQNDSRVNRETCRELGIASVLVIPIFNGEQPLGVFEIFSGTPRAFDESAVSAVERLSAMVELAVKFAVAAQASEEPAGVQAEPSASRSIPATAQSDFLVDQDRSKKDNPFDHATPVPLQQAATTVSKAPSPQTPEPHAIANPVPPNSRMEIPPPKPLFWSAVAQARGVASSNTADTISVPPVLRNLQKCQACGFPVSHGRKLCVECEEKQWRGQRLPRNIAPSTERIHPETESWFASNQYILLVVFIGLIIIFAFAVLR